MAQIKVTRGVPGSGKSTWAKQWVAEDPENRGRVNRDDIRAMIGITRGVGTDSQERTVTALEEAAVKLLLGKGRDVVVDATHLKAAHAKRWFDYSDDVEFVDFPISFVNAFSRDLQRSSQGGRGVGKEVIATFFDRYHIDRDTGVLPKAPKRVVKASMFKEYVPNTDLPNAIIVDIDGTLAHARGRGPYDTSRYHEDDVDPAIRFIVSLMWDKGVTVLVTSGRDSEFAEVTAAWLMAHDIPFDALIMREQGDTRNDAIVKDELFETFIAPNYNVLFALDDRNRVVDMWRAKGVKTLQVQPGDF